MPDPTHSRGNVMRKFSIVAVALVAAGVAAGGATTAMGDSWHTCRGGFDVQGKPSQTNNTFRQIRERGSNCPQARGITQRWIIQAMGPPWPKHLHVGTFACTRYDRTGG